MILTILAIVLITTILMGATLLWVADNDEQVEARLRRVIAKCENLQKQIEQDKKQWPPHPWKRPHD